ELTRLFLRAYAELHLIYPKPHCRFSARSSGEYLRLILRDIHQSNGIYLLLNDDCLIPALIRDGKEEQDARRYLCSGCWDIVVESCENNSGANYYNLARVLEASIFDPDEKIALAGLRLKRLDAAGSFAEVFTVVKENLWEMLGRTLAEQGKQGANWSKAAPRPFYSVCLEGCLENGRDETAGGSKYAPRAASLLFFANIVDSLLAVKTLCYDRKHCSLPALLEAVRHNWADAEKLRNEIINTAPYWGDGSAETAAVATELYEYIIAQFAALRNERGGKFQPAFWSYREFTFWGKKLQALPDGRKAGDELAQSLNPSHFRNRSGLTTVLCALAVLDLKKAAGNSIVNLTVEKSCDLNALTEMVRAFAVLGLQALQLNCFNREELLEARKHPEKYQHLVVRICGFSAKFVSLSPEWQEEVLKRCSYASS
ncbi:MAG: pyruvate formate lyase family protein, partial [Victivallales bacterium]|nr:pyruvate formate lyase family protein [Victivallales bacterium]